MDVGCSNKKIFLFFYGWQREMDNSIPSRRGQFLFEEEAEKTKAVGIKCYFSCMGKVDLTSLELQQASAILFWSPVSEMRWKLLGDYAKIGISPLHRSIGLQFSSPQTTMLAGDNGNCSLTNLEGTE